MPTHVSLQTGGPPTRRFWRTPLRAKDTISQDFLKRNVALARSSRSYLAWYPEPQYNSVLRLIDGVVGVRKFDEILVDPPEKVVPLDFDKLSSDFLLEQMRGTRLDLRDLAKKYNNFKSRPSLTLPLPVSHPPRVEPIDVAALEPVLTEAPPIENNDAALWAALRATNPFITSRGFRDSTSGSKVRLQLMDLRAAASLPAEISSQLANLLNQISGQAWEGNVKRPVAGYSCEYVQRHFLRTDRLFLAFDQKFKRIVGFAGINQLAEAGDKRPLYVVEVSMVLPEYQDMRLISHLTNVMLTDALFKNNLGSIRVATRTANPQVAAPLQILRNVFPNAKELQASPTADQSATFEKIAEFLCPGLPTEPERFVIRDVYPLSTGLITSPERFPASRSDAVNDLCRKSLDVDRSNRPIFFQQELEGADRAQIVVRLSELGLNLCEGQNLEAELNALLQSTGLYDSLRSHLQLGEVDKYLRQLIDYTEKARASEYSTLDPDMKETVCYLNRMLLEALVPQIPKRAARALIVMGEFSLGVTVHFRLKNFWKKLVVSFFAALRSLVRRGTV